MAESRIVEIFEHEEKSGKVWSSSKDKPWVNRATGETCPMLEEINTPGAEWNWESNWKIEKRTGVTDEDGWEYASKTKKFYTSKDRTPKSEPKWSDKARRRLWCRVVRRDATNKHLEISKVIPRIQQGLTGIYTARMQLEDILSKAPEQAKSNPDLQQLSLTIRRNVDDMIQGLDQMEKQCKEDPSQHKHLAVIKKLRNDCVREQSALGAVLASDGASNALTNTQSNSANISTASSSSSRASFSTANPKRGTREWNARNSGKTNEPTHASTSPDPHRVSMSDVVSSSSQGNMRGSLSIHPKVTSAPTAALNVVPYDDDDRSDTSSVHGDVGSPRKPSKMMHARDNARIPATGLDDWDRDDGVFVDRYQHEQLIEQRLRPVDEATVLQEIIEERAVEIQKMHKGIVEVNEMFKDLANIVKGQQFEIDAIFQNAEEAAAKTKDAFEQVVQASRLQEKQNCIIC